MAKKNPAERMMELLARQEALTAKLVATARRLEGVRRRIASHRRRMDRKEREAAGHPSNAAALAVECTQCNVGAGARCISPTGSSFARAAVPFHKARIRRAVEAIEHGSPLPTRAELVAIKPGKVGAT